MSAMITRPISLLRAAAAFFLLSAASPYAAEPGPLATATVQYREVEQTHVAEGVVGGEHRPWRRRFPAAWWR
jgi:hypothetical protein